MASPALAQSLSPDAAIDRAEALADRGSDISAGLSSGDGMAAMSTSEASADKPKLWSLGADIGFSYVDNAGLTETGKLDSAHFTPNIKLKREFPLNKSTTSPIKLSIEANSAFDAYTERPQFDTTAWGITTRLGFGDATQKIAPYLLLNNNGIYAGQWGTHIVTTHTYGIGASRRIGLRDSGKLDLDLNLVRREATILTSEANRAQFGIKYSGPLAGKWTWSASGRLRYFDFTGGTAVAREDFHLLTGLGLSRKFSDNATLNVSVQFARNWSNVAGKSYTSIDVGPSLALSTAF